MPDNPGMWQRLLELLYVPHCITCDLRGGSGFCPACAESLYQVGAACPRCAEPASSPSNLVCGRCRRRPPPFAAAFAGFRYGGELGEALRLLKHEQRRDVARSLGPYLAPYLARAATGADVAVPIPLHWRRLCKRGFNQAAELLTFATQAGRLALPIDTLSLRRVRPTAPQRGLGLGGRERNVRGAFLVRPERRPRLAHKRILLVDDVMTTGATLAAAARALLHAGAAEVIAFAAARAEP